MTEAKSAAEMAKQQAAALSEMRQTLGWKILWDWYDKMILALEKQQARVDTVNTDRSSDLVGRQLAYNQGFYAGTSNLKAYFLDWLQTQLKEGKVPTASTETPAPVALEGGE